MLTVGTNYNNSIGLFYKNPVNGFFANASGIYSIRRQNNIEKVQFNGIFQQVQKQRLNISNTNFNLFSNVSKSFSFWKSLLNFKYIYSNIERTQFISEILTKYRNQSHNIEIGFSTQPIKMLNFEGEVNYLMSQMKIVDPEHKTYDPIKNIAYKLSINVIPSKRFQISWSSTLISSLINCRGVCVSVFREYKSSILSNECLTVLGETLLVATKISKSDINDVVIPNSTRSSYSTYLPVA